MRRTLSTIFIVLSFVFALAAFGVPVNTSWTYQGQLQRSGAAYTGTCNFQFSLWDALSAGTQQGGTQAINSVNVVNGLFTVVLDFGDLFKGDARWLGTSVQCNGDGGFTPLDPRQPLTAAPYALSLRPGATINGGGTNNPALSVANLAPGGSGLLAQGTDDGVLGTSDNGNGVSGYSTGQGSAGVFGSNSDGPAIWGLSTGTGPAGQFDGGNGNGVVGSTNNSFGRGVSGLAGGGAGSAGVYGQNTTGAAIHGHSTGSGSAIFGENVSTGLAGRFAGNVSVEGNLFVTGSVVKGGGTFRIDHPLDPEHKFLSHSFVESPDMMNIYNGNVTTDATGSALVTLPAYFEALNRDYRYQLTVLGQFAQAIVSRKIAGNRFEIQTDKPGIEVSWQVTGIRQDAYARAHPIVVEEFKPAEQQGTYLFPAGFGAGEEKQIGASSRPAPTQDAQGPAGAGPSDQGSK